MCWSPVDCRFTEFPFRPLQRRFLNTTQKTRWAVRRRAAQEYNATFKDKVHDATKAADSPAANCDSPAAHTTINKS